MRKILVISLVVLLLAGLLPINFGQAATKMQYFVPQQLDVNSNAEVCLGDINGGFWAGMIIEVEFSPDQATHDWLQDLTISDTSSESEFSIFYNTNASNPCTGGTERIAETAPDNQANRDVVEIIGNKIRITLADNIPAGNWFGFKFTDKTDADTNALLTPAAVGNYQVTIRAKFSATSPTWDLALYSDLIYVGNLNQTDITASVDPTLTLTLGDFEAGYTNACPLGTFEVSKLAACGYSATVTTNATNGYTTYIREDHDLWNLSDNTKVIADVTDGAVTPGGTPTTEEYGLAVQTVDTTGDFSAFTGDCVGDIRDSTDPQDADALAGTDQVLASYAESVDGVTHGKSYLCHVARRQGATVAGNYGHTITVTVVGNF